MKLNVKNLIYLTLYKALINTITNHKFWQDFEKNVTWYGCKITLAKSYLFKFADL